MGSGPHFQYAFRAIHCQADHISLVKKYKCVFNKYASENKEFRKWNLASIN